MEFLAIRFACNLHMIYKWIRLNLKMSEINVWSTLDFPKLSSSPPSSKESQDVKASRQKIPALVDRSCWSRSPPPPSLDHDISPLGEESDTEINSDENFLERIFAPVVVQVPPQEFLPGSLANFDGFTPEEIKTWGNGVELLQGSGDDHTEEYVEDRALENSLSEGIPRGMDPAHLPFLPYESLLKMKADVELKLALITQRGLSGYEPSSPHYPCLRCNAQPRDIVLLPCRHQPVCQSCCSLLRCPVCKTAIKNRIVSKAVLHDPCPWIRDLNDSPIKILL